MRETQNQGSRLPQVWTQVKIDEKILKAWHKQCTALILCGAVGFIVVLSFAEGALFGAGHQSAFTAQFIRDNTIPSIQYILVWIWIFLVCGLISAISVPVIEHYEKRLKKSVDGPQTKRDLGKNG